MLELIVVFLLLLLACLVGVWIAPGVFGALAALWRDAAPPPSDPDRWPPEKNITPPPVPGDPPRKKP